MLVGARLHFGYIISVNKKNTMNSYIVFLILGILTGYIIQAIIKGKNT